MKKPVIALLCAVFMLMAGIVFCAAIAAPGDEGDPLVTKSYIDTMADEIRASSSYRLIKMKNDQQLVCAEGAELILRQGGGVIFSGANGGLADVTLGADLKNGEAVPPNHLLVVPVSDWRGFTAVGEVLVLVRGDCNVYDQ